MAAKCVLITYFDIFFGIAVGVLQFWEDSGEWAPCSPCVGIRNAVEMPKKGGCLLTIKAFCPRFLEGPADSVEVNGGDEQGVQDLKEVEGAPCHS